MSLYGYTDDEFDVGDDNKVTLISSLDVSNHLHLHPNDSVALTVVSMKLKRTENYQVWSCAMLLALDGKNKTGFIDGSCKRAKHVWEELKETYDKVDGSVTFSLHHKIHTLGQNGSSIVDYYHKLNALWKQFDALIELPRCLDDTYMKIRSSILSREALLDVRSAYAIISNEESHRVISGNLQRSQTSARFSRPSNDNRPNDNGNRRTDGGSALVCENCGFNGKNVSNNNFVGSSSSNWFFDEQMATLISLIKENFVNGKGVHANMAVSHPNGTEAFITKIRNMPLTNYLTLYDVLVMPGYCVSLMSVHKVARDSNLVIAFDEMHCYVLNQDLRAGKILGTCKQIGGLYYFDGNQAKQTREHFPLSDHVLTELGELVHLDLWGPYKVTSIVDDFSRFKKHIKVFRSENSTEFVNQQFNALCESNGIIHQISCSYTPQQNGIVERKHKHLLNVARSLLFQGWIPLNMWTDCILTAIYLINILPTSVLNGKSPYDLVYNKHPSLKHSRSFGSLAYATILNSHDKFGSRSEKYVLVGYSNFKKGYKLWSLDNKQIIYSRDVKFFEDVFPFKQNISTKIDTFVQDVNHLNFFNTNTLEDLLDMPNDEERRNPNPNRHGNSPSHSGCPSASSKENDGGHF
ncbi:ribonuclease H-like domain-containing protein [Tanacetum coccineum]